MTDDRTGAAAARRIRLRSPPAARGLHWIRAAVQTFLRRPGGFASLFGLAMLAIAMLAAASPAAAAGALLLGTPLVSLGFMVATESVLAGGPVRAGQFLLPLTGAAAPRRSLLALGVIYLACGALLVAAVASLDGGALLRAWHEAEAAQAPGAATTPVELPAEAVDSLRLIAIGLSLLTLPLWHAPALVHWGGQGVMRAMFSSVLALWHTRAAFALYGIGWILLNLAFGLVANALYLLLGDTILIPLLMMPLAIAFMATFFISLYFCFVETFELVE